MPAGAQPATPRPDILLEDRPKEELDKLYHLILHDSDDHTYQYVIDMLNKIFGYSREKAFAIAALIDREGQGIVETADHETVKKHQDQIHRWGPDPRMPHCKGSLSATIEEAA